MVSPSHDRPVKQGLRGALLTGLGVVLALLVTLGAYAARSLSNVSYAGSLTTRDYLAQSQLLENAHGLLSANAGAVRDYLLDKDSGALPAHRERALRSWSEAMEAIEAYKQVAKASRRRLIDRLDAEVAGYWAVAKPSLEMSGQKRLEADVDLLLRRLVPWRERYLTTISEIGAADRADLRSAAENTAQFVQGAERRLWAAIAVTVLLSLVVAGTTVRYLIRLENTALAQYRSSVKTGVELERLYHRLLTLQEDERRRIARELHDDYGQRMASLLFELSAASEHAEATPALRTTLQEMGGRLANIAKDVQQLSRSLHSAVLEKIGLEAAIRSDCAALRQRSGWEVDFRSSNVPKRLPEHLSLAIYRVFQEAIQNALKHSGTNLLAVSLAVQDANLILRVKDQGQGFDPHAADHAGSLGLISMRERMRMVGGAAVIQSEAGKGTEVEASVPIAAA